MYRSRERKTKTDRERERATSDHRLIVNEAICVLMFIKQKSRNGVLGDIEYLGGRGMDIFMAMFAL